VVSNHSAVVLTKGEQMLIERVDSLEEKRAKEADKEEEIKELRDAILELIEMMEGSDE
jgi:uncharacterized protein (UPF0305 family)